MNFTDTLRGLLRRWYIVLPGLIIAAAIAAGAWFAIPPSYSRSATQLLIPGESSIPEDGNPYLFLGGLAPAADVLVRAIGSENVLNEVVEEHPGVEIAISRDITTGGPIFIIAVTAGSDAAAEEVLTMLLERTTTVLDEIQEAENISKANRMTVIPVTVDKQSEVEQRSRLLATVGAAIIGTALTLLLASLVDGSRMRRRERTSASGTERDGTSPREGNAATVSSASDLSRQNDPSPPDPSDDEPTTAAPHVRVQP